MKCESKIKHSLFFKKIRTYGVAGSISVLLMIFGLVCNSQAQMFSVGDQGPRFNTPQTEFYAGLEPINVTYKGGNDAPTMQSNAFEMEGPIIRVGYNSPGVDLFLGTGGKISGIDEASYFDVGGNIDFGLNLLRKKALTLQLPVRIASRYTNITNDRTLRSPTLNRFRFGSLTAGIGARILGRPQPNLRLEAGAVPSYGFSFASQGFTGGSMGSVAAFGRVYADHLFGDVGLSIGYKYDLRNYDVEENVYDYKMNGHSIEMGITF